MDYRRDYFSGTTFRNCQKYSRKIKSKKINKFFRSEDAVSTFVIFREYFYTSNKLCKFPQNLLIFWSIKYSRKIKSKKINKFFRSEEAVSTFVIFLSNILKLRKNLQMFPSITLLFPPHLPPSGYALGFNRFLFMIHF